MIVTYIVMFSTFVGLIFSYFNLLLLLEKREEKRKLMKLPKVSIIVPAYNEEAHIAETIESLLNLDYPKDKLEIIVIDDGSTDRTYNIAKKYEEKYPDIVKVYRKRNGGKASALNFGIKLATGKYIATMDADSVVPREALKKMLEYFTDERVMIVIPAVQVKRKKTFIEKVQYIEYSYNNTLREIFEKLNSIYVAPGPFSVFRRELFEKIGYFDENNLTEDMEIALRAQHHGYRIRYCPEVIIKTETPKTFKQLFRQRIRWYLGFVENYLKYRKIRNFLLRELVFASAWIFIIVPTILLLLNMYFNLEGVFASVNYYLSIKFDILPEILYALYYPSINWEVIKTAYIANGLWLTFLGIVIFIIFILLVRFAWKYEKDRSIGALIAYSYMYTIVYSIFWLGVFYYKIFGKELRWGGIVWKNSLLNKLKNGRIFERLNKWLT